MMKIKQVIDGTEVIGEVSDDTATFMVDRGYATLVTEDAPEAHDVARSATRKAKADSDSTPAS